MSQKYNGGFTACISLAHKSASRLVNLLYGNFPCFRDAVQYEGREVRFLKRAQILVADLWACFDGKGYGEFHDIDSITMFADYRVPQMLYSLSVLRYSRGLERHVRQLNEIGAGSRWEIEIRGTSDCFSTAVGAATSVSRSCQTLERLQRSDAGCSIYAVEKIRRQMEKTYPETKVNAVLIDFFLYDSMKEIEREHGERIPHHRTRSIWY